MINKLITLLIVFITFGSIYGQDVNPDSRLEVKYSKAQLNELKRTNPEELKFLNFCIGNAFTIMPLPQGKKAASEIKGKVNISNLEEINFFDLGIELEETNWQYYSIEGTQEMLVIFSKEEIERKIKK